MAKSELIRFRCTIEQREAIESAAKAANMDLTNYILSKLDCSHKNKIVATNKANEVKNVATKVKNVATKKELSWAEIIQAKRKKKA